jgi:F-type H+-transporting ATPase subunit epsilon
MAEFQVVVVTPEKTALEQSAQFVALPAVDGELGILANHSPMIARLGFGEMRIESDDGKVSRYYIDGGFAQIADNVVTVLSDRAIAANTIDVADVQRQLDAAQSENGGDAASEALRQRSIARAKAQLKVASK